MSAFDAAIVKHVAASVEFTGYAADENTIPDHAKDWSLAAKNSAQAALALVQAKKTHEDKAGRR
jgi:hypothetical protein